MTMENLQYLAGFHNHFASEALPDALPKQQNSPQQVNYGLYIEQISGTAFTAPRANNLRSWLYRIRPSVQHGAFKPLAYPLFTAENTRNNPITPNQLRWDPLPMPTKPTDFLQGLIRMASSGDAHTQQGGAIYHYACNSSMQQQFFYNADGEFIIIPQQGHLLILTELGRYELAPEEILVIPRGIKFQVHLCEQSARGYVGENYGQAFSLPELGPIGANGLANPRDFQTAVAWYEQQDGEFELITKFHDQLFCAALDHCPFDVVAWHGNYAPYKYNLNHFNTINTVSFDHPDPSIFTVLTSQSNTPGVANIDFVIFPARWSVAEHTFRPPYFHRNIMSEYMGLIKGQYDAKPGGFQPGGASLHNCMSPHGPDSDAYQQATNMTLKPQYYADTLAFMFEGCFAWQPSEFALTCQQRQAHYQQCWQGLPMQFKAPQ